MQRKTVKYGVPKTQNRTLPGLEKIERHQKSGSRGREYMHDVEGSLIREKIVKTVYSNILCHKKFHPCC